MAIILAYKTAKDFVAIQNKDSFTLEEVEKLLFNTHPTLLEYANGVLNEMHNYIAKIIIEKNLSFSKKDRLIEDPDSIKLKGARGGENGLDPRTYYLLRYVYEKDTLSAYEDLENFEDFSTSIPIV